VTVLVVTSGAGTPLTTTGYAVRLGPLRFVTTLEDITEPLGGTTLDTIGEAVAAGERKARPFKLSLPVRGSRRDSDKVAAGQRLRRQIRQLFNGDLVPWWFDFEIDPELACWLIIGGAELSEVEGGATYAEWRLELTDCYVHGRPGTHRPARRMTIADRRLITVARDSRGTLFSTDFSGQAQLAKNSHLPGDVEQVTGAAGTASSTTAGDTVAVAPAGGDIAGRRLWRTVDSIHGEVEMFDPTTYTSDFEDRYALLDDAGAVRVWDISNGIPGAFTSAGDVTPDGEDGYLWERVYGDLLDPSTPLAIDNGTCRLVMLGDIAGVALERWNPTLLTQGGYDRAGRVWHRNLSAGSTRTRILELTTERVVISLRQGNQELRLILQRGWKGPRVECYTDSASAGTGAVLEYVANGSIATNAQLGSPTWVREITITGQTYRRALLAPAQTSDTIDTTIAYLSGSGCRVINASAVLQRVAVQIALGPVADVSGADVASLSLVDAQAMPTIVERV
jgi:hypothetical protein